MLGFHCCWSDFSRAVISSLGDEPRVKWLFTEPEPWPAIQESLANVSLAPVVASTERVAVIRDIFGNPFRPVAFSPSWRTGTCVALAQTMYDARDYSAMPILADALQDAGCDNDDILAHCRDTNATHVRGCWVVDLVLGKE